MKEVDEDRAEELKKRGLVDLGALKVEGPGSNEYGYGLLTYEDLMRTITVFDAVAGEITMTDGKKVKRLTKEQFGMAISLLGLKKSEEQIRKMFERKELKLADLLSKELFILRVECFRRDNISDEKQKQIPDWFNSIYSLMCEDDSQIDEVNGQRYILASQMRSLLTEYGLKISGEEADMILRECHPKPDEDAPVDQGLMRIYFGQYQSMLIDEGV